MPWNGEPSGPGWGGLGKRRLSWQQPIVSKLTTRYVADFDELLTAIGDYSQRATEVQSISDFFRGRRIVLTDTIFATSTIVIDRLLSSLVIDLNGFSLVCSASPAFTVSGPMLVIENGGVFADFTTGTIVSAALTSTVSKCTLRNLVFTANRLITGTGQLEVIGCSSYVVFDASTDPFIAASAGSNGNIQGNYFNASSKPAIILTGTTTAFAISGNHGAYGGATVAIDTSAAGGSCTVVGNTRVGTVTVAGSDSAGNNT